MFKKRIVFCLLFLTGIFLVIFPLINKETPRKISASKAVTTTSTPSSSPTLTPLTQAKILVPTPIPQPTPVPAVLPTSTPTATPISTPAPVVQTFQVNLSINSGESLAVNVDQGNNQCDVLTKALQQGKISSLNMRYDSNLGTDAVYQINGIGKENSVWWTYKVNGLSPFQGCSYLKANNGDKIEWNYLGS